MLHARWSFVASFVLATLATAQSKVWVVGPGGAFAQIHQALAVASDGDTVLVKSGTYAGFVIDDVQVNVVADNGAGVVISGAVRVINLDDDRDVVLVGLRLRPPSGATTIALELSNDAGSVRVEGCSLEGSQAPTGGAGARVTNCADVSFVRCPSIGGRSTSMGGAAGLSTSNSQVAAYECEFVGGAGGNYSCPCVARSGGSGVRLDLASFLFAAQSSFHGGIGGNANTGCLGCSCGADGGDGGHGLVLIGASTAKLLDDGFAGGLGGAQDCGADCGEGCEAYPGLPGQSIAGSGATVLTGASRVLTAPNPVRELTNVLVVAQGQPGDAVYLWVTPQTNFRWVPNYHGVQLTRATDRPRFFGTIGASGTLSKNLIWGDLGAGEECAIVYLQAAMLDATGQFTFSSAVSMVILDSAF